MVEKPAKETIGNEEAVRESMRAVPNTPVFMQVQIGLFDRDRREALQDALKLVADYWDSQPYSSDRPSFRFELDGHLFELHVSPLHPSGRGLS